ncbi:hypothetical protein SHIRM173S_09046 [Streptomyces hirsutus]
MLRAGIGVAPGIARRAVAGRVVPGGLLPLGLGGQSAPGPAGVRVRLVPAHVQHRLVGRHGLGRAEATPQPPPAVPAPEERGGDGVAADVGPALRGPPARLVVAAVLDERLVRRVRHRRCVDVERRHLAPVRRTFVVQRPRLVRGAHGERAARDEHFGRAGEQGHRLRVRGRRSLRAAAQLMGDQHRLVVLLFVLRDHPEGEPRLGQPLAVERGALEHVQCPAAHVRDVAASLLGRQQRQLRPLGTRVLEGVVDAVDLGPYRLLPADGPQQPLFLLVAYVGEVPHQRRHQRRVLRGEIGPVDAAGQQGGPVARGDQRGDRALAQGFGVEGGVGHEEMSFPCGCAPRACGPGALGVPGALWGCVPGVPSAPARRASSRSSAGQRPRAT